MIPVQRIFPKIMQAEAKIEESTPAEAKVIEEPKSTETISPPTLPIQTLPTPTPTPPVESIKKEMVTSRVENVNEGYCPVCGETLSPTEANGINVLACFAHNIVMPIRDR